MFNKGLFSSARQNWRTPEAFYRGLDAEFSFDFDPCPPNPCFDGLSIEWGKRNFVNPPYGGEAKKWIKKAWEESRRGNLVVMLIASRTDTKAWHAYVMEADEIRFIKGRLHFDGRGPAPFPSAIVVFRPYVPCQMQWRADFTGPGGEHPKECDCQGTHFVHRDSPWGKPPPIYDKEGRHHGSR